MKEIYPPDIYMSPAVAIIRMNQIRDKYGEKAAYADPKFKEEREAAITAVFLLGYRMITNEEFWLQICQNDPPDIIGITLKPRENGRGKIMTKHEFEVSEWEGHSKLTLAEAIKAKLKNKAYPANYALLIQVRRPGAAVNLNETYQLLHMENIKLSSIWIVGSAPGREGDYLIAQLFPQRVDKVFNILDEMQKHRDQEKVLKQYLGISDEFTPLGEIVISLP